jgi:hypothetical protein
MRLAWQQGISPRTPMQIAAAAPASRPTNSISAGFTSVSEPKRSAAEQAFLSYQKLTPAEKFRASILDSLHLTEDQLKALPPDKRAAIEKKIQDMIREKTQESVEKKTGLAVDLKA